MFTICARRRSLATSLVLLALASRTEGTEPGDPPSGPFTWRLEGDTVRVLQPGDSTQLVAIGEDAAGQPAPADAAPTWSSSDGTIVAIGEGGWARGLAPGS